MLVFAILLPTVCGLSIVSKTDFSDSIADSDPEDSRSLELVVYGSKHRRNSTDDIIPLVLRRGERRNEAKIPVYARKKETVKFSKGKQTSTENVVPFIRGATSKEFEIDSPDIEGLRPPSPTAAKDWFLSQSLESSTRYPDSNGYYPIVGDYPEPTPRPTYGVPQTTNRPYSWCSSGSGGSNPWGKPQNPNGNNGGSWNPGQGYPPSTGGRPWGPSGSGNNYGQGYPPSQGGGQYPPNQGGGQYPPNQGGQYPPGQGGQYPPNQGGGQYPPNQGQYPPNHGGQYPPSQGGQYPAHSNQGGSWGQNGQYPPGQWGGSSSGQGGYPSNQSGGGWSALNGGQNRPWSWGKAPNQGQGQWVPCKPYDLSDGGGRITRSNGASRCPQQTDRSDSFIPPPATPVTRVDDKIAFEESPRDVEEISP